MKKIEEKVYRYLSGLMDKSERDKFEIEIRNSKELAERLEFVREKLSSVERLGEIESGESYFNNLIPRVRARLTERKVFRKQFRLAIPVLFSIFVIFYSLKFINNSNREVSFGNFFSDSDSIVIDDNYFADDILEREMYSGDNSGEFLNVDSYTDLSEINLSDVYEESTNTQFADYQLLAGLSTDEIDEIYKDLLNEKIF